jgi:hypothetical protein
MKSRIERLVSIVDREQMKIDDSLRQSTLSSASWSARNAAKANTGTVAALLTTFEGPGLSRQSGPRHDNDAEHISEIRIAPTNQELMSRDPPFLPANFYGAPHIFPDGSMQRLLDIQFRLLREELTYAPASLSRARLMSFRCRQRADPNSCAACSRRPGQCSSSKVAALGHFGQERREVQGSQ